MPPVSQAQRRWAFWVLNNSGSKRLKKVAKDFIGRGITGLPERVEDGEAVEKSLHFEEVRRSDTDVLFTVRKNPGDKHHVRVGMAKNEHAEGQPASWSVVGIFKHPNPDAADSVGFLGAGGVREIARHLKAHYGIDRVTGLRVSGARQRSQNVSVDLSKALKLTAHEPRPVQAGKYQQVSHDWHHEGTSENPFNERQRVVTAGDATGIYSVREDPARLNHYHVQDVRAVTRGGGRAAMEHLTRMADRHQVSLQLVAEPLRPQGDGIKMTRAKLQSWYQSHGFRPRQGDLMVRTPTKLEKSMSPFTELKDRLEKSFMGAVASGVKAGAGLLATQMKHEAKMVQRGVSHIAQGRVGIGVERIAQAAELAGKSAKGAVKLGYKVFSNERDRPKRNAALWERIANLRQESTPGSSSPTD